MYGMFTSPVNGVSDATIIREGYHKIKISTENTLTDDQVRDLYWLVLAMSNTGKTLKELFPYELDDTDGSVFTNDRKDNPKK